LGTKVFGAHSATLRTEESTLSPQQQQNELSFLQRSSDPEKNAARFSINTILEMEDFLNSENLILMMTLLLEFRGLFHLMKLVIQKSRLLFENNEEEDVTTGQV
jgi:hypothetical protein